MFAVAFRYLKELKIEIIDVFDIFDG